ncbi:MAG: CSLREA domain-containing protein, partial [Solirubrobacterales bacterium]|nr:CSLREA domain-containing protein [Solirubrobacterales bacterium]
MRGKTGVIVLAVLGALVWCATASAATFNVTKTVDTSDGSCAPTNCSLRDAVNASNATAGPNTITLHAGSYRLSLGELALTQSVTISGLSPAQTTIDAGGLSRIFDISSGGPNLAIEGMTLTRGNAPNDGGAIFNNSSGSVTVANSAFTNNSAGGGTGFGGAIDSSSTLPIGLTNATFTGNRAGGTTSGATGFGGAIDANGAVTGSHVSLINNGAGANNSTGFGGGIDASAAVTLTDSTLSNNFAGGGSSSVSGFGGAIITGGGALTLSRTILSGNVAGGGGANGFGGAVEAGAAANVSQSAFTRNTAGGGGGEGFGGALEGNGTMVTTSSVTGNTAGGAGGRGFGGGLEVSSLTATNSTIADNSAGAGSYGYGGGIDSSGTTLSYSTVAGNTASYDGSNGGGGGVYPGGGTDSASIVANNSSGRGANCFSAASSNGYNIENGTSCGFAGTGDLNADPKLAPTANNGGPGPTRRLLPGSPAIDHVPTSAGCPATDERGVGRPQGAACDVGAYEVAPPSASTGPSHLPRSGLLTISGAASNPDVVPGTVYFQWGRSTSYGKTSGAQPLPAGAVNTAYSFAPP